MGPELEITNDRIAAVVSSQGGLIDIVATNKHDTSGSKQPTSSNQLFEEELNDGFAENSF